MASRDDDEDDLTPDVQGHFLEAWLDHLDVDQVELGRRLGWHKTKVSRKVNNQRRLPAFELRRIANALGLRAEALLHHPTDQSAAARAARMSEEALAVLIRKEFRD